MDTPQSHLQDDGTVFPPVTPDPPIPPGQEEIQVPDIVPPKGSPDASGGSAQGSEPTSEQTSEQESPTAESAPELQGEHTPSQGAQGPVTEPPD